MGEFMIGALPFVLIGIWLAIIAANYKKDEKNYLIEGMCLGMGLGVCFSASLSFNLGLGISFGMLVGETIGVFIKKK